MIKIPHVRCEDQLVDILTNAVGALLFEEALSKLGVSDPMTQLEGGVRI